MTNQRMRMRGAAYADEMDCGGDAFPVLQQMLCGT